MKAKIKFERKRFKKGKHMKLDSNIISIFILAVVYIVSVSLNAAKTAKKTYFYFIIYSLMSLILIQMALDIMETKNLAVRNVLEAPLKFTYMAALPLIPAFYALHVTAQKNPRALKDKFTYAMFFVPTAINLVLIAFGAKSIYSTLISVAPVLYATYVVVKFRTADSFKTNASYSLFALAAAAPAIINNGLILSSMGLLILFLVDEIVEARKDSLTGINNRKYLYDYTQRLINQSKKFTVVMFDLDKLKHINDNFGHIEGDEAIVNATSLIKSKIRQKDFFARYAGDEFVLVVESCDLYNIKRLLHRIDKAFEGYNSESSKHYTLSISSGFYVNDGESACINELIERADSQMFKNKRKKLVENWQSNIELLSVIK